MHNILIYYINTGIVIIILWMNEVFQNIKISMTIDQVYTNHLLSIKKLHDLSASSIVSVNII